jgi:hypothetical protein
MFEQSSWLANPLLSNRRHRYHCYFLLLMMKPLLFRWLHDYHYLTTMMMMMMWCYQLLCVSVLVWPSIRPRASSFGQAYLTVHY